MSIAFLLSDIFLSGHIWRQIIIKESSLASGPMALKVLMTHEPWALPFSTFSYLLVGSQFFFVKYKINAVAALVTYLSGHHGPLGFLSVSLSLSAKESFALTFVVTFCNVYFRRIRKDEFNLACAGPMRHWVDASYLSRPHFSSDCHW